MEMPPRVFSSSGHALILNATGKLYGIGCNTSGEISDSAPSKVETPFLITDNIISAAAGRGSIFVTNGGEVKIIGDKYLDERFKGFQNAMDVFSSGEHGFIYTDVAIGFGHSSSLCCPFYWIKDVKGTVFGLGGSDDGILRLFETPEEKVEIYRFPEEIFTAEHTYCIVYGTGGTAYKSTTNIGKKVAIDNIKRKLVNTDKYRSLIMAHGEPNIDIDVMVTDYEGECIPPVVFNEKMVYNQKPVEVGTLKGKCIPRVVFDEKIVYNPRPVEVGTLSSYYIDIRHGYGSVPVYYLDSSRYCRKTDGWLNEDVRFLSDIDGDITKIKPIPSFDSYVLSTYYFLLKKTELFIGQATEAGLFRPTDKKISVMNNVFDMSLTLGLDGDIKLIISTFSGRKNILWQSCRFDVWGIEKETAGPRSCYLTLYSLAKYFKNIKFEEYSV